LNSLQQSSAHPSAGGITAKYMNEKEFQKIAGQNLLERVYKTIRSEEASA